MNRIIASCLAVVVIATLVTSCAQMLNSYAGQGLLALTSLSAGELTDSSDPYASRIKFKEVKVEKNIAHDDSTTGIVAISGLIEYVPAKRRGTVFTNWSKAIFSFDLLDGRKVLTNQVVAPVFPDSVDTKSIEAKHMYPFSAPISLPRVQWERVTNVRLREWSSRSYY